MLGAGGQEQEKYIYFWICLSQKIKNLRNLSRVYIYIKRIYVNPIKKNITDIWKYVFMNSDHVLKGNEIFFLGFFWLCFSLSSYLNMKRYMYNNKENGFIIHPLHLLLSFLSSTTKITYSLLVRFFLNLLTFT